MPKRVWSIIKNLFSKPPKKTSGSTDQQLQKVFNIIINDEVSPFLKLETRAVQQEFQEALKLDDPSKAIKVVGIIDRVVDLSEEIRKLGLDCLSCGELNKLTIDYFEDDKLQHGAKAMLHLLRKKKPSFFES